MWHWRCGRRCPEKGRGLDLPERWKRVGAINNLILLEVIEILICELGGAPLRDIRQSSIQSAAPAVLLTLGAPCMQD